MSGLRRVVIACETEAAARARLIECGYSAEIAAEIAVYLAQSTDLPEFMPEIRDALDRADIKVDFVELEALPPFLARTEGPLAEMLLWNMTDGIRFYRGSAVPALGRLLGLPTYGSSATAQHICQDKFLSIAAASAAGLSFPPTMLVQNRTVLAGRHVDGPYFVKPNTLGAKIGVFADSRCETFQQALDRASRVWDRYQDTALIQPYVPGDDVRVSYMHTGADREIGVFRLQKDANCETGGDFMTMKDNETLSGARDSQGARGGFGATRDAAFVPVMTDLHADPAAASLVADIEDAVGRLRRIVGLRDYFSMDFRIDSRGGRPVFLEFEVCPAVTIYDFQAYLRAMHGLTLGEALARSVRLAHRRHAGRRDA
jgi:D-alanine-D-alanine ligase